MSPDLIDAVHELAAKRLSKESFINAYLGAESPADFTIESLRADFLQHDQAGLEYGLIIGFVFDVFRANERFTPILSELASDREHHLHLTVVRALEDVASSGTLSALEELVTLHPTYIVDSDAPYELARAALWAISKLGSADAMATLHRFQKSADANLADLATRIPAGLD